MKIEIMQSVKIEGDKIPHTWSKKIGERNIIPHKGDKLEDSLWKDPYEYEVSEVIIDYGEDTCFVMVSPYEIEIPKERMYEFGEIAKLHGWEAEWVKYMNQK